VCVRTKRPTGTGHKQANLRVAINLPGLEEIINHSSSDTQQIINMSVSIYPPIVVQRDLSPDHGGSKVDDLCEEIHTATKGWGVSLFVVFLEPLRVTDARDLC
jgi:hypothetical protein